MRQPQRKLCSESVNFRLSNITVGCTNSGSISYNMLAHEQVLANLPTYLNTVCIRKALEKAHDDDDECITIRNLEIKRISADGENFCSDIYRAHVKYERNKGKAHLLEKSLIIKDMKMDIAGIGSNEYEMYEQVLPHMEAILYEGMGETIKLKPSAFLLDRVDKEIYVLEDLNAAGYKLANRWLGLDEAHARVSLAKIAQFHAASMMYAERFPVEVAALAKSHFSEGAIDPLAHSISFGGIQHAIGIVAQWEYFEDIAEKMRATLDTFNERVAVITSIEHNGYNVINHGDLWLNNALYRHADGAPKDVVFVDFQNCFLGSPGLDINYFLNTSVQLDVLKSNRYELLRHYYTNFQQTLSICGASNIPSWQMFMEEVRHLEFFGYYAAVCELPICCMSLEASKDFTTETFIDAVAMVEKRKLMYDSERVLKTLRYALDRFNELGVLD